jgi:hypothetical protein
MSVPSFGAQAAQVQGREVVDDRPEAAVTGLAARRSESDSEYDPIVPPPGKYRLPTRSPGAGAAKGANRGGGPIVWWAVPPRRLSPN